MQNYSNSKMSNDTTMKTEFEMMSIALFVAFRALLNNETPVACIMVDSTTNTILNFGYNGTNDSLNGTRHAEFIAIDKVLNNELKDKKGDIDAVRKYFHNIDVYVTVEPCIMCALALKQIGIRRVVYGCGNDRFGGNGTVLAVNQDTIDDGIGNYHSYGGVLRLEAIQLLRNFYIQENDTAPQPKIKKNKELQSKEYPPNIKFNQLYPPKVFEQFYVSNDSKVFMTDDEVNREITPNGNGYSIQKIFNFQLLETLPGIEHLFSNYRHDHLKENIYEFFNYFYSIDDNQKVDFSFPIVTLDTHKKRKPDFSPA